MDLVTLRSVEGAAEVLELEVVWQIDNRTAVASVACEVSSTVVCVRVTIVAASEFFVKVEQFSHASGVSLVSVCTAIGRDSVVVGERILSTNESISAPA